jgi:hypothetical protein
MLGLVMLGIYLGMARNSSSNNNFGAATCQNRVLTDFNKIKKLINKKPDGRVEQYRQDINQALMICPKDQYPFVPSRLHTLTYLDFLILTNNPALVKAEIDKHDHGKAEKAFWTSPLIFAAHYGDTQIVEELIRVGYDVNAVDVTGNSPLMMASGQYQEYAEITKTLVEHGAKVSYFSPFGYSPLTAAIFSRNVSVVKYLIQKGALNNSYPYQCDKQPEYLAANAHNQEIITLISKSLHVSISDIYNYRPTCKFAKLADVKAINGPKGEISQRTIDNLKVGKPQEVYISFDDSAIEAKMEADRVARGLSVDDAKIIHAKERMYEALKIQVLSGYSRRDIYVTDVSPAVPQVLAYIRNYKIYELLLNDPRVEAVGSLDFPVYAD